MSTPSRTEAVEILGVPQSIYVRTVRMACEEKGIQARLMPVAPHSPEVLAINPFGTIPAFRHGNVILFESQAIVGYLDAVFAEPRLVPAEPAAAALMWQWVSALNTRVIPTFVRYARCYFQSGRRRPLPDLGGIAAVMPEVASHFAILERAGPAPTGFIDGQFTVADLALVPILDYLAELDDTRPFLTGTQLAAYLAEQRHRPSFSATAPRMI